MNSVYAKIQSAIVVDIQLLDTISDYLDPAFDWVDVTNLIPRPSAGWGYDGNVFTAPGLPNDVYGRGVTLVSDDTHDIYTVAGLYTFTVAKGTAQATVYLAIAKQGNIALFTKATQDWVTSKYILDVRFNLMAIYNIADPVLNLNRRNYIKQIFTWAQSVVAYCITYNGTVNALTDANTVFNTTWDFTQVAVPDPHISSAGALAINN